MITIGISKWPVEAGKEVGKRSLEMKSLPDFIKLRVCAEINSQIFSVQAPAQQGEKM